MVQKQTLPNGIFPCKDCVLIVQRKYAENEVRLNDSLDTLLIYEDGEIIKREPVIKMTPGGRYCKGYFSRQMSLIKKSDFNQGLAMVLFKAFYKKNENWN